ncbi:metal ABC transporter permease [Thalassoroseus pseudoceratinae]|uniref:metal ABC transporter permease n=1 Tax=Thalassoroseus pseudoceratinae TaxID=2713176 RepID=UPI00197D1617|nr:metal ABC transporter permease [Thalassoroseus pseudoceratinae]
MNAFWNDYTVQVVVSGSAMIGAVSGSLGCFAYLRRQSLIGDVVAHSTLLGIVVAFWGVYLVTGVGNKSLWVLIPGAIVAGLASLLLTKAVTGQTRIKEDAGLGVMLAIFFGTGMMLLRWLQRAQPPIPGRSGLDGYLFGMAAAMTSKDLWMIGLLGAIALMAMLIAWSGLKVLTFDPEYAAGIGLPVQRLELLMLCLMVIGIVIGLQIAGVVLMISLLVAPAAAARQWTHHLGRMVALASIIGAVCAASGALISALGTHLPTGPVIVVLVTIVFIFSILFAPRRGILWRRRSIVD